MCNNFNAITQAGVYFLWFTVSFSPKRSAFTWLDIFGNQQNMLMPLLRILFIANLLKFSSIYNFYTFYSVANFRHSMHKMPKERTLSVCITQIYLSIYIFVLYLSAPPYILLCPVANFSHALYFETNEEVIGKLK